jgi:hypothetical protein
MRTVQDTVVVLPEPGHSAVNQKVEEINELFSHVGTSLVQIMKSYKFAVSDLQ